MRRLQMGASTVGRLVIEFHGLEAASIAWAPSSADAGSNTAPVDPDLLAEVLALFYAHQLFALGRGPAAEGLLTRVARGVQLQLLALQAGTEALPRLLPAAVTLVDSRPGATQRYEVLVTETKNGTRRLQLTQRPEDVETYGPQAVLCLLQWMIDQLDADGQAYVLATVLVLHRYYRSGGKYELRESISAGPRHALAEVRYAGQTVGHG